MMNHFVLDTISKTVGLLFARFLISRIFHSDTLTSMKELAERNAATNAAVLVLLTHVLKGEALENGDRDAASSLLSNSNVRRS